MLIVVPAHPALSHGALKKPFIFTNRVPACSYFQFIRYFTLNPSHTPIYKKEKKANKSPIGREGRNMTNKKYKKAKLKVDGQSSWTGLLKKAVKQNKSPTRTRTRKGEGRYYH